MALVIGSGGAAVESIRSYVLVLLPATERTLLAAIRTLELALEPEAEENLLRMSRAVEAYALDHLHQLAELDLNPVIVRQDG